MLIFDYLIDLARYAKPKTLNVTPITPNKTLRDAIFVFKLFNLEISILSFGIAKDIVGRSSISMKIPNDSSVGTLKALLREKYPNLGTLKSFYIALNEQYAVDSDKLEAGDEIVLLPPASGG